LNDELAILFAKRFIQRRDVKAVQFASGAYIPDRELKNRTTGEPDLGRFGPQGFLMNHLHQHLNGEASYGHYLLDDDSICRMFAFDIDLRKTGFYTPLPSWDGSKTDEEWAQEVAPIALGNPEDRSDNSLRDAWLDRAHPCRPWIKTQMGMLARKFVSAIQKELGIPCAAAYSGNKGIHVYGFTGPLPAVQVRAAATFVIESTDDWVLERGSHQYGHKLTDPSLGYPNFSIEVFPKQDSLDGKDLGNLMRLPLGRNLKSPDPTFFLDLTTPPGVMAPHPNPVKLLEDGNPYDEAS
jgi:hypothetical protein